MAKGPTVSAVAQDFQGVMTFLASQGIVSNATTPSLIAGAKRLHACTYSLVLWRFRLRGLKDCGKVFVQELASDALQILPQALMGYNKTTKLLNRSLIENVLRHLYFADHPVEFRRMHGDKKWYVSISALKEYAMTHPVFSATEARFAAVSELIRLYSELSAGVHGSRVNELEMRVALERIKVMEDTFKSQLRLVQHTAQSINFLLAVYHNWQFRRFYLDDRRVILHTMVPKARRALTELE